MRISVRRAGISSGKCSPHSISVTAELGIRAALGATPSDLFRLVLRETAATSGSGIAVGALAGAAATLVLRSQLFGIHALEWLVLFPAILAMSGISASVAYLAARPWIRGDAWQAVRHN